MIMMVTQDTAITPARSTIEASTLFSTAGFTIRTVPSDSIMRPDTSFSCLPYHSVILRLPSVTVMTDTMIASGTTYTTLYSTRY